MKEKEKIKEREKKRLQSFFNREFDLAPLKLKKRKIKLIKEKGMDIHFLPSLQYGDFPQEKLSDFFVKLKEEASLKPQSLKTDPGWVAVEKKPKPRKEGVWLRKNFFFDFLDSLGADSRSLCKATPKLKFRDWGELKKRFGVTRKEISSKILKDVRKKADFRGQIRLPYYLEYVYLGEAFYHDWGKTRTWEWLQDELKDGRFLAAGCKDASRLGADPKDHWSSILGFRFLARLENNS